MSARPPLLGALTGAGFATSMSELGGAPSSGYVQHVPPDADYFIEGALSSATSATQAAFPLKHAAGSSVASSSAGSGPPLLHGGSFRGAESVDLSASAAPMPPPPGRRVLRRDGSNRSMGSTGSTGFGLSMGAPVLPTSGAKRSLDGTRQGSNRSLLSTTSDDMRMESPQRQGGQQHQEFFAPGFARLGSSASSGSELLFASSEPEASGGISVGRQPHAGNGRGGAAAPSQLLLMRDESYRVLVTGEGHGAGSAAGGITMPGPAFAGPLGGGIRRFDSGSPPPHAMSRGPAGLPSASPHMADHHHRSSSALAPGYDDATGIADDAEDDDGDAASQASRSSNASGTSAAAVAAGLLALGAPSAPRPGFAPPGPPRNPGGPGGGTGSRTIMDLGSLAAGIREAAVSEAYDHGAHATARSGAGSARHHHPFSPLAGEGEGGRPLRGLGVHTGPPSGSSGAFRDSHGSSDGGGTTATAASVRGSTSAGYRGGVHGGGGFDEDGSGDAEMDDYDGGGGGSRGSSAARRRSPVASTAGGSAAAGSAGGTGLVDWSRMDLDRSRHARDTWSVEEDTGLAVLVERHGKAWQVISSAMGNRTPKQVRERWQQHLRPGLNKGPFTTWEDVLILKLQGTHGNKWSAIAGAMEDVHGYCRADNSLKNRFHAHLKKHMERYRRLLERATAEGWSLCARDDPEGPPVYNGGSGGAGASSGSASAVGAGSAHYPSVPPASAPSSAAGRRRSFAETFEDDGDNGDDGDEGMAGAVGGIICHSSSGSASMRRGGGGAILPIDEDYGAVASADGGAAGGVDQAACSQSGFAAAAAALPGLHAEDDDEGGDDDNGGHGEGGAPRPLKRAALGSFRVRKAESDRLNEALGHQGSSGNGSGGPGSADTSSSGGGFSTSSGASGLLRLAAQI